MRKFWALALVFAASVLAAQQFPPSGTTGGYRASSGSSGVDLELSLIHWWKFESGPPYADSIGIGSWLQGTGTVAGKSGNGIGVSPGAGSVGVSTTTDNFLGAWQRGVTVTFWVNATSYTDSGSGAPIMVSTGSGSGWDFYKNPGATTIQWEVPPTGVNTTFTGDPLPTGAWHFVVLQCPAPLTACSGYINMGVVFTTASTSLTGNGVDSFRLSYNVAGHGIVGVFDEMGVWNRMLTLPELQELYNGGNGKFYPF